MADQFDLVKHLHQQRDFSARTFGPGPRTAGVVDHLRRELVEVEAKPSDLSEWIDVVLLALDGAWRAGFSPEQIVEALAAKQRKNEARQWPDWRTQPPDRAIEHVKGCPVADLTVEQAKEALESAIRYAFASKYNPMEWGKVDALIAAAERRGREQAEAEIQRLTAQLKHADSMQEWPSGILALVGKAIDPSGNTHPNDYAPSITSLKAQLAEARAQVIAEVKALVAAEQRQVAASPIGLPVSGPSPARPPRGGPTVSDLRLLVCEGPCNPGRESTEAMVSEMTRERLVGSVVPVVVLRALVHTPHVYTGKTFAGHGCSEWWICRDCGTKRRYGLS